MGYCCFGHVDRRGRLWPAVAVLLVVVVPVLVALLYVRALAPADVAASTSQRRPFELLSVRPTAQAGAPVYSLAAQLPRCWKLQPVDAPNCKIFQARVTAGPLWFSICVPRGWAAVPELCRTGTLAMVDLQSQNGACMLVHVESTHPEGRISSQYRRSLKRSTLQALAGLVNEPRILSEQMVPGDDGATLWRLQLAGEHGGGMVIVEQYNLFADGRRFVVTFCYTPADRQRLESLGLQTAKTLRSLESHARR